MAFAYSPRNSCTLAILLRVVATFPLSVPYTFSSIDNTRILAAREAGIDVQANVRAYNERLPDSMLDRFEHPKVPGGYAQTWGEALEYRILRQNKTFQKNNYPVGSYQDPKVKYNVKDWFNLD